MAHRWKQVAIASGLAASLAACADLEGDADAPHSDRGGIGLSETTQALGAGVAVDPRRSLAVTDTAILGPFTLTAVVNQLVAQNGGTGFTATQLFRQLWDTQNGAPGQSDLPGGAHCTDNGGTLNGFAYPCRPTEGQQAQLGALVTMTSYNAIGLFNRFDLAPTGGADCGEYRIVFAKNNASPGRNFIIFEAVLPNPRPDLGLEGCRPVTNFWRDLTTTTTASARSSALQSFYFKGLPGFSPVIHMNNYGNNSTGAGQVRTNMFMQPLWLLRELKLKRDCSGSTGCTLRFAPVTVKTNPFGDLFNPASVHPLAAQFQNTVFPSQVAALAVNDINRFSYSVPDQFNVGQSDSQTGGAVVDNYVAQFGTGPSAFRNNIQAQLTAIGSTLSPDDIVARAQTQSCGGCHQRSNNAALGGGLPLWPSSALFVHNSESTEVGPDGTRFQLSPALTTTFLPHRKAVLESFLNQPRKLAGNLFKLTAVAAVKDTAYFLENTNPGTVWKVPAGGSPIALAGSRFDLAGVATDAASVYWVESHSPGDVLKVPAAGGAVTTLSGGRTGLVSVATDGVDVYWLEQNSTGGIFKVPAAGGATTAVLTGRVGVRFIAVDAVNVYWIEGTTLLKMPKAGGAIAILAGGLTASSLATDGVNLYWTENLSPGNIKQMPVAGGPQTVLHSGPLGLVGAAVDATSVYWLENTNPGVVMAGPR